MPSILNDARQIATPTCKAHHRPPSLLARSPASCSATIDTCCLDHECCALFSPPLSSAPSPRIMRGGHRPGSRRKGLAFLRLTPRRQPYPCTHKIHLSSATASLQVRYNSYSKPHLIRILCACRSSAAPCLEPVRQASNPSFPHAALRCALCRGVALTHVLTTPKARPQRAGGKNTAPNPHDLHAPGL